MNRLFSVLLLLAAVLCSGLALAADHPPIVLSFSEAELDPVVRRVRAELGSAGYDEVVLERRAPLGTCTSRPTTEASPGQVGVLLRLEGEGIVSAEICTNPQVNQVTVVTARGRLEGKGDFAIIVTEALHGLLTAPNAGEPRGEEEQGSQQTREPEPEKNEELEREDRERVSIGAESRVVLDAQTGRFWIGVAPGIQIPVHRNLKAGAELFLGLHPVEYSDDSIDLKSHLAWARVLVGSPGAFGPFELGWTGSLGLYSNRVTAEATAPRRGGSDGAFGAILGAGVFGEFPARGAFYLNGSLGASTLVPRLNYQMSEETTPTLGRLLFEGALGLGVRLDSR